jgi:hypothetical protein
VVTPKLNKKGLDMGMSTFFTMDTHEKIRDDLMRNPTKIKLIIPHGVLVENATNDGYLRFDGIDYFEALAELNGLGRDRERGLDLFFDKTHHDSIIFPKPVSMGFKGKYTDLGRVPTLTQNYTKRIRL